jgi:hypothetical protein
VYVFLEFLTPFNIDSFNRINKKDSTVSYCLNECATAKKSVCSTVSNVVYSAVGFNLSDTNKCK